MALIATLAACSGAPPLQTAEAVGQPLSTVNQSASDDTQFLIQDSSPQVGAAASFSLSTSDANEWIVVAICADAPEISSAGAIEISIIPQSAYTATVKSEIDEGKFVDAVTCDGLTYR